MKARSALHPFSWQGRVLVSMSPARAWQSLTFKLVPYVLTQGAEGLTLLEVGLIRYLTFRVVRDAARYFNSGPTFGQSALCRSQASPRRTVVTSRRRALLGGVVGEAGGYFVDSMSRWGPTNQHQGVQSKRMGGGERLKTVISTTCPVPIMHL